jgi:hypothetical protein
MAVYVDELKVWGRKPKATSHLTADSEAELVAFVRSCGIPEAMRHRKKTRVPHYDVTAFWRRWALLHGAQFKPAREQARARMRQRSTQRP